MEICLLIIIIILLTIILTIQIIDRLSPEKFTNLRKFIRENRENLHEKFIETSEKLHEKLSRTRENFSKTKPQQIKSGNVKEMHDRIFDENARIEYYTGGVNKKKFFVKLYDQNFKPSVYVINSSFFDGDRPERSGPLNNYLDEMSIYYKNFIRNNPNYKENQIIMIAGDVGHSRSKVPFISKTRPIGSCCNVILPLNNVRHWKPVADVKLYDIPYEYKKNVMIWRGATTGAVKRLPLVSKYYNYPGHEIDVGFTNYIEGYEGYRDPRYIKERKSMGELLGCKFIISVEGNDVATNLKWIMASNSLCIKPESKVESWLMEGLLKPWVHYVPVKDDFSDLLEIYGWCVKNPEICKQIIANCNDYINRFMDGDKEFRIINKSIKKYCDNVTVL